MDIYWFIWIVLETLIFTVFFYGASKAVDEFDISMKQTLHFGVFYGVFTLVFEAIKFYIDTPATQLVSTTG